MAIYDDLPRRFNLTSYFLDRNLEEGRGDRTALICNDTRYTYADVAALTNRVGHVLRDLGVEIEDRVLLALSDGIEFVATWFAVPKIGAVVSQVYTFLQPKDYEYYLNYTRAKVAVVDETTLANVRTVAPRCKYLRYLLVAGDAGDLAPGEVSFTERVAQAPAVLDPEDTTKDDIALWKFTTGTTGDPKGAVHCHHDPVVSFHAYALDVLDYTEHDAILPVPKLFFGYGRDLTILFAFGAGARGIVFPERTTVERIFALIQKYRPTILVNVPTMMKEMVHHPDAGSYDLRCLRACISSGEALPGDIFQRWHELFGVEVLEGIGSSEAYHIYISNRPGAARPGSAGQLVPGYQAKIVDAAGEPLATDEIGELWVAGESMALLYWNDHEKSKRTFSGDWIRTGDMFRCDEDGYFWYQGRSDDMIKVSGIWVSPVEIETCLREHPAVLESAVVPYDEDGLLVPQAFIVLKSSHTPSDALIEELQVYVKTELAPHKYPRRIAFIERLPKTASGKIDRKRLQSTVE